MTCRPAACCMAWVFVAFQLAAWVPAASTSACDTSGSETCTPELQFLLDAELPAVGSVSVGGSDEHVVLMLRSQRPDKSRHLHIALKTEPAVHASIAQVAAEQDVDLDFVTLHDASSQSSAFRSGGVVSQLLPGDIGLVLIQSSDPSVILEQAELFCKHLVPNGTFVAPTDLFHLLRNGMEAAGFSAGVSLAGDLTAARKLAPTSLQNHAPRKALRFSLCGGLSNMLFSLAHGAVLAKSLGLALMVPPYVLSRHHSDAGGQQGSVAIRLSDLFDLKSIEDIVAKHGIALIVQDWVQDRNDPTVHVHSHDGRLRMQTVGDWRNELHSVLEDTSIEAIDIHCSFRSTCVGIDSCCCDTNEPMRQLVVETLTKVAPAPRVVQIAHAILGELRGDGWGFNALHFRFESDWYLSKKAAGRNCFVEPDKLVQFMEASEHSNSLRSLSLYLMGDYTPDDWVTQTLSHSFTIVTKESFGADVSGLTFDQLAAIDLVVGREAQIFVGNDCSTLTASAAHWRDQKGFPSSSTLYYTGWTATSCEARWLGLPEGDYRIGDGPCP